ncbi:MAG: hypothetical protein HKN23_03545 [Verrucomicrobiales bacterium]|nr:hypothetical protein [Verrucomicrobiales bacterium]
MKIAPALIFLLCTGLAFGEEKPVTPLALLQENCVRCHTPSKRKGGLLMDSREGLLKGGDTGPSIVPGNSGGSFLTETLFPDADPHMPPKGQLKPQEIVVLEEWIDEGAPWDGAEWEELNQPKLRDVKFTGLPDRYQPVLALALSPDGKTLAAGRGNVIEIYAVVPDETAPEKNPPAFEKKQTLAGHVDAVQSLAFSQDGKSLASGGFRRLILWNPADGSKIHTAENDPAFAGRLTAMAFSKNGDQLLIADSLPAQAGKIHAYDPKSKTVKTVIESAHDDTIFDLKFSPDGKGFATASADKLVILRNMSDFKTVRKLEGHTGYVLALSYDPDGKRLASAGDDEAIKIWNLEDGKQIGSFGSRNAGPVTGLAWTTDPAAVKRKADEKDVEKKKAINTDRVVSINELGTPGSFFELVVHEGIQRSGGARERAHDPAGESLASLAFDMQTGRLYSGAESGRIFVWDEARKKFAQIDPPGSEKPAAEVAEK